MEREDQKCACVSNKIDLLRAYTRKEVDLRKARCPSCGKEYWTNRDTDYCLDCDKKPTTMCEQLVQLTQEVLSRLGTPLKLVVRRRGDTPAFRHSPAPAVPAIIIDGKPKFGRRIPSEEELIESIRESCVKLP